MLKRLLAVLSLCLLPLLPQESCARPVRLVFTGDIMVHDTQLAAAKLKGKPVWDFDYQFELAKPFLRGDAVIGNLETVLGGKERKHTGYPAFNSPDSLACTLREAGFEVEDLDYAARLTPEERTRYALPEDHIYVIHK